MLLTGNGHLRTDRVPLDAFRRSHVMPLCDIFCKSKHNHHTLSTLYAKDYSCWWMWLLFESAQIPQISILCTPVLSGSYDVWGGTHGTNSLKTNTIYITFTAYLTQMHETTCFALQIKRTSSLPTVRNQTDINNYRRRAKLKALAYDLRITSWSNATGVDTATATPCAKSSATS